MTTNWSIRLIWVVKKFTYFPKIEVKKKTTAERGLRYAYTGGTLNWIPALSVTNNWLPIVCIRRCYETCSHFLIHILPSCWMHCVLLLLLNATCEVTLKPQASWSRLFNKDLSSFFSLVYDESTKIGKAETEFYIFKFLSLFNRYNTQN